MLKYKSFILNFFLFFGVLTTTNAQINKQKKFETSFIFHGLSSNVGLAIGAYKEYYKKNGHAELLVGICGASFISALIYIYPDINDFEEFIQSPLFHDFFKTYKFNSVRPFLKAKLNVRFDYTNEYVINIPQNIKSLKIENYKSDVEKKFLKLFNSPLYVVDQIIKQEEKELGLKSRALMIISARSIFHKDYFLKSSSYRQFTENFFITDQGIKRVLKNKGSIIYKNLKESEKKPLRVLPYLTFNSTETLYGAIRASISEPILINNYIDSQGHIHLAGSISQHPYEYTEMLSEEITGIFNGLFPQTAQNIFFNSFNYSLNTRIKSAISLNLAKYYIDLSSSGSDLVKAQSSFAPTTKDIKYKFPLGIKMDLIPSNHNDFLNVLEFQIKYGEDKTKEAFKFPHSSQHINLNQELSL